MNTWRGVEEAADHLSLSHIEVFLISGDFLLLPHFNFWPLRKRFLANSTAVQRALGGNMSLLSGQGLSLGEMLLCLAWVGCYSALLYSISHLS